MTVDAHLVVTRGDWHLDVHLTLAEGTTTAVLGPNGAGKSTALAALAGLVPLDDGHVRFGDRPVDVPAQGVFVPPEDRGVGVVFQDGRLFDHLSVRDNVAFPLRSRGSSRPDAAAAATAALTRIGIEGLAERRPARLSGGEAQRVALCRALVGDPDLLLLDEPMSALDVAGRASLRRVLADHLADVVAPRLLVTHDPIEAFLLARDVVVVEDGRVTQTGTPDEIRQHPLTPYAADLVGTNLVRGVASGGLVDVDGHPVQVAGATVRGPVLLTIHPRAVALASTSGSGSQRNVWETTVVRVEPLGDRTRVTVGAPLPITAEVTPAAVADLDLRPGSRTWVTIKATEIEVTPDLRPG